MTQILTAEQVARRLSLEPSTIRRWVKKGLIPRLVLSSTVIRFEWNAVVKALRELDANRRVETGQENNGEKTTK